MCGIDNLAIIFIRVLRGAFMKKLLLIIGGIAVVLAASLYIIYDAGFLTPPLIKFSVPIFKGQNSENAEEVSEEEEHYNNIKKQIDRSLLILDEEFKSSEIKWRYDRDKNFCYYDIINPRIDSSFVEAAQNGDKDCRTEWDNLIRQMRTVQRRVQRIFIDADEDTGVVLSILDSKNIEEVLLSVAHAVAGYDAVNGIDISSNESGSAPVAQHFDR